MQETASTTSPVVLQWSKIIKQFNSAFYDAFCVNKKAHFDNVPEEFRVVDGAKEKWCSLLMLDAIIFILNNDGITSSTRRTFNQHRILFECIFEELQSINPAIYSEIVEEKNAALKANKRSSATNSNAQFKEKAEKYSFLRVRELQPPWDSMKNLCISLLDTPPSKAKNKYITMVQLLTSHESLAPYVNNLSALVQVVICRALFIIADAKVVTPSARNQATKRRGSLSPELCTDSESDRSPRLRTYSGEGYGTINSPGGLLTLRSVTSEDSSYSMGPSHSMGPPSMSSIQRVDSYSPYMMPPCPAPTPTSGMASPIGASPASKKRVQGTNNMMKKRPSLEQQQLLHQYFNGGGCEEVLVSPVSKYFCHCGLNSPACTVCVSGASFSSSGGMSDAEFNSRLQMMFGTTATHSAEYPMVQPHTTASVASSMADYSVATSKMLGFSQTQSRLSAPPTIQLPPLFIPQSTNRFEQDVREQADQHSGLTPTIAGMKLLSQKISPPPGRVISPHSQYDAVQSKYSAHKLKSPIALSDYEHTPSAAMNSHLGCAEKQQMESSGSTPYLEDFCLTADEYQLLLECTQEHEDNTQHVSVKQEMLISPKDIGDDETVFSFNPERDLLNSSGPRSMQDINVDDFDADLLDWTPSSSFLFEGSSGKYNGKDVTMKDNEGSESQQRQSSRPVSQTVTAQAALPVESLST